VLTYPGILPGIWSRSLAVDNGIAGSMIPYFRSAIQNGFGIIVFNPNTNTATIKGQKVKILHSSQPDEHVLYVWQNYVVPAATQQISFITYDNGGQLVKYLLKKLSPDMRVGLWLLLQPAQPVPKNVTPIRFVYFFPVESNIRCHLYRVFARIESIRSRLVAENAGEEGH
jgi:hypothetical protein